jgi:hypothetical protein
MSTSSPDRAAFDETHLRRRALNGQDHVEFDWEALALALGEPGQELGQRDRAELRRAIRAILAWLLEGSGLVPGEIEHTVRLENSDRWVGRRAIALMWVIMPDALAGSSLRAVARCMGLHAPQLAVHTAEFSARFGILSAKQSRGWNRRAPTGGAP